MVHAFLPLVFRLIGTTRLVSCLTIVGLCLNVYTSIETASAATWAVSDFQLMKWVTSRSNLLPGNAGYSYAEAGWQRKQDRSEISGTSLKPAVLMRTVVDLEWTAPGDDGDVGRASNYDVRYALFPISESNWELASSFRWPPTPDTAGSYQIAIINGLETSTPYYFAVKAGDKAGNWSGLSNVLQDTVRVEEAICGDATADGYVSIADVVAIINYIFGGGPPPSPMLAGDSNCSGQVNLGDAIHLLNYFYSGGSPPCCLAE